MLKVISRRLEVEANIKTLSAFSFLLLANKKLLA